MTWLALSLMPQADFLAASLPVFEAGLIDALEFSFDVFAEPPDWACGLLDAYAAERRLFGHGVTGAPLSAAPQARWERWLEAARAAQQRRPMAHVSEHLGVLAAGAVVDGSPMPLPFDDASLALGDERLSELAEALGVPVGLENLGLAFSRRSALAQGPFLRELLSGERFLVLDLHNLYCLAATFELDAPALLESYPLEAARVLHLSGGSWMGTIRRDTHDAPIPAELWPLLDLALEACPRLEAVVYERLGGTMPRPEEQAAWRVDVERLRRRLT